MHFDFSSSSQSTFVICGKFVNGCKQKRHSFPRIQIYHKCPLKNICMVGDCQGCNSSLEIRSQSHLKFLSLLPLATNDLRCITRKLHKFCFILCHCHLPIRQLHKFCCLSILSYFWIILFIKFHLKGFISNQHLILGVNAPHGLPPYLCPILQREFS